MKSIIKKISIIGMAFAFSHAAIAAESLYSSNVQSGLVDTDKDGVIGARDLCPSTPNGSAVDNNGCPAQTTQLLSIELNVLFDSGKAEISPRFYSELQELAAFLQQNPNSTAVIEGHTDDKGSEKLNRELSQKRASAIADVLVDRFRIQPDRVKGIGYGESRPIDSNLTEEGRAQNRRVVAEVYAQKEIVNERWTIFSVDNGNGNTNTALNNIY
ncbi:thrombospondin [Marinomonas ushuaiensis DSM 15871]|uniref:Thrombospondin n=1 Tax=Marinomonas ushuaiensis DSM 15871 TaxID=1122207 RepID=X7E173_9GAMM|nr:OmpA family protein [Marinomonas ushuaiensis]ETX09824.1 thrombospondin [Marinomonas ushuaiensis DSM 15871]